MMPADPLLCAIVRSLLDLLVLHRIYLTRVGSVATKGKSTCSVVSLSAR